MQQNNIKRGALFMLLSVSLFAFMDLSVKALSAEYPIGEIIFFRGLGGIVTLLFLLPKEGWANWLHTKKPGLHFTRAASGTIALFLVYLSLSLLPLATVVSLTFLSPVFSTLLSIFILGEVVRIKRWFAIFLGFFGMLIIVNPTSSQFSIYMVLPILFCIFFSIVSISIRKLSETESVFSIAASFTVFIILSSLFTIPFFGEWVMPVSISDAVLLLLGVGFSGGAANLALTAAYSNAPVSSITPLKYLSLVYGVFFGYVFFAEIPAYSTYIGSGIIIIASLIILQREKVLKKDSEPEKFSIQR